MKIASVLVALLLVVLPVVLEGFYLVVLVIRRGTMAADELTKGSQKLERFRSQHKVRFWVILSSYLVLSGAALLWMMYEILAPHSGYDAIIFIWSVLLMVVTCAVPIAYAARLRSQILKRLAPRPEPGSASSLLSEWELRYSNEMADNFLHFFVRGLLVSLGITAILLLLFVLTVYYLS